MKKHRSLQHYRSGKLVSDCSECGFKTKYERSMICHKLSKHNILPDNSVKVYPCNVCKSRFLNKRSLSTHIRKHTGERLFVCDYCKNSFMNLSGLKSHKISAHIKPKTFICSHCSMKFSDKESLEKHFPKQWIPLTRNQPDNRKPNHPARYRCSRTTVCRAGGHP